MKEIDLKKHHYKEKVQSISLLSLFLIFIILFFPSFNSGLKSVSIFNSGGYYDTANLPHTSNVMKYTEVISKESVNDSAYTSLAIDRGGNVHIAWEDKFNYNNAGNDTDIFYRIYNVSLGEWGELNLVSAESANNSERVKLKVDGNGNVHFVWSDFSDILGSGTDADIFYKNYSVATNYWSDCVVVSTESSLGSHLPNLAIDDNDNIHIAWHDFSEYGVSGADPDIFYKNYTVATNIWSVTEVVSTESTLGSYRASIELDAFSNIHIAWEDLSTYSSSGTDVDIFYKNYTVATGSWSTTTVVSTESTSHSQKPSLKVGENGDVHIAWEDFTNYNEAGSTWDIFYKNYTVATGSWGTTTVVSTESTLNSYAPSLGVDGEGNIHIAYEGTTNYNGAGTDRDIFYKNYTFATESWSNTEVISTESISNSFFCSLALDLNNNVHIAWEDLTNYNGAGTDRDIFYKINVMNNTSPTISSPNDLSYIVGSVDNHVSWTAFDMINYKPFYQTFFNGTPNNGGKWLSGVPIEVSIDGLPIGSYNLTIIVDDGFGAIIQNTVFVLVIPLDNPLEPPLNDDGNTNIPYQFIDGYNISFFLPFLSIFVSLLMRKIRHNP
jgi:ribosomal protein L31